MTSALFQPLALRGLTLPNRIVVSPMCMYSAEDGSATDWHTVHLGGLALSGAGLLIIEATGVEPRGRITHGCLGLYSDENEAALRRVLGICRRYGNMPLGIQLGHAGRKASVHVPSAGGRPLGRDEGAWTTVAPSAIPFEPDWHVPEALDRRTMDAIVAAFVQATVRADRIGLDLIEVHAAHGYLLSEFLSPIANARTDEYGGDIKGRMRFPLEVFEAMRAAWPADKPMGVRCNGTDWDERGLTPDDAVAFAKALKSLGCDYVDVSSGGNVNARIPLAPGYQVPFAARVRREAGIATMAVGMIRDPHEAEAIVADGRADMVALGRGMLYEPHWPWHAAEVLGAQASYPPQYARSEPSRWAQAFPERARPE